jgi:hypothetical protein
MKSFVIASVLATMSSAIDLNENNKGLTLAEVSA